MNRATKITGLLAIMAAAGGLSAAAFLMNRASGLVVPGIVLIIGFQTMAAFWGLGWALPRSNSAFFSIFVGDALLKMTGLALATWWLWSRSLPYTGPLLTLGFAFLIFSLVQIPFFYLIR